MSDPIQSISTFVKAVTEPITSAFSRAFTMPGTGENAPKAPTINLPDPKKSTPAKIPGSKPSGGSGMQSGFLSGVVRGQAGSALPGGGGDGGRGWSWGGGKRLIGQ